MCFHRLRYPNYGELTSTPAGLSPAEHASLRWTHNHTVRLPRRRKLASYARLPRSGAPSAFMSLCSCLGMCRRRPWFSLNGKMGIQKSEKEQTSYIALGCSATSSIHATTPQAGQPKVPLVAQGLLERGLMRLQPTPWPPRLFFTEAGLAALRAMMANAHSANPKTFAHVRQELGIDPRPDEPAPG
jgi:hypothetical protein